MTPDLHSSPASTFDAQLLQAYVQGRLSAAERLRVDRLLTDSELARTALAGFTAFPEALQDVAALKAEIAARSGVSGGSAAASKSWLNWLAGGAGIAAVVVAAVVFWPSETPQQQLAKVQPPAPTAQPKPQPEAAELNPATDHFVNPQAQPLATAKPVAAATENTPPAETPPPAPVSTPPTAPEPEPQPEPVVATTPPAETGPAYNSPVIYVLDLKITDYKKYYNQPLKVNTLRLTGTPASQDQPGGIQEEEQPVITADQVLREGLTAFRDGRYGRCITRFEQLLKNSPDDVNAKFYMAVSYTKLELYVKALPLLDQVLAADNNAFHEEAAWYKVLALIGTGNAAAARVQLEKIAAVGGFYQQQAKEKLKQL